MLNSSACVSWFSCFFRGEYRRGMSLLMACLVISLDGFCAEMPTPVSSAGVSFACENSSIANSFPYCSKVINENINLVESNFRKVLENTHNPIILIDPTLELNANNPNAIAMTFALDGEFVTKENLGNCWGVYISISAQILFFDWHEKKMLSSYPVGINLTTISKNDPDDSFIQSKINAMLLEPEGENNLNLFSEFSRRMETLAFMNYHNTLISVRNITLATESIPCLPQKFQSAQGQMAYKKYLGDHMGKSLSYRHNIPVLPYMVRENQSSVQKMPLSSLSGSMARLAGKTQDGYALEVRDPDFVFDISVEGFKKVLFKKFTGSEKWIYASYAEISFLLPATKKCFFKHKFKNGWFEDIPTGLVISDSNTFRLSLNQLIFNFTEGLDGKGGDDFIKTQGIKDLSTNMRSVYEKIKK